MNCMTETELKKVFNAPEIREILRDSYFRILSADEYYRTIELRSENTGHGWIIRKIAERVLLVLPSPNT